METKIALKIILISVPIPMFWACLMLQRSRWIFQAVQMDGDLGFYTIKPDQMIVFNSVIAVLLIPIIDKFIYPLLEKVGIKTMLQRLIFGGVLIIIALINAIILQTEIEKDRISILWQLPQYMIIGTAEILTYLSHLNFAYKEAPASMKPVMMSLLYLSMAGGDMIVAIISGFSAFQSQVYEFSFFACLVLVDLIILAFLASNYKHTDHEALNALDDAPSDEKIEENTKC
jgi:dipeptide/tripeptide permease